MPAETSAAPAAELPSNAAAPGRETLARAYRLMHTAAAMADLY